MTQHLKFEKKEKKEKNTESEVSFFGQFFAFFRPEKYDFHTFKGFFFMKKENKKIWPKFSRFRKIKM
jgi:hypothetical protein